MKRFFSRNIDRKGRIIRGGYAVVLFIGAWFAFGFSSFLGVVLTVFAVLALFEALRGWCVMRACGIKTKH